MKPAVARLAMERKAWLRNHPPGFDAHPKKTAKGTLDLMVWECIIPGKVNTSWANGYYTLELKFSDDYPTFPPICTFVPPIAHACVSDSGIVSLPFLDPVTDWNPDFTIKQILTALQDRIM